MSCPTLGDAYAANWAQRVVNNGGARPAQATINAAATFWNALKTAGIHTKMIAVNIVAPDSLVAAQTPLFVKSGNDPWTYSTIPSDWDLNVGGIRATNATRGMILHATSARDMVSNGGGGVNNVGLTLYSSVNVTESGKMSFGAYVSGGGFLAMQAGWNDAYQFAEPSDAVGPTWSPGSTRTGYLSGNRTGATAIKLYFANGATAHSMVAQNSTPSAILIPAVLLSACGGRADGVYTASTAKRFSFFAVHQGLTEAESSDLFDAVQSLRVILGGGFYPPAEVYDTLESYADTALNGLNGGTAVAPMAWGSAYVARGEFRDILGKDTFETYADTGLDGLNGGTGFDSAYVGKGI